MYIAWSIRRCLFCTVMLFRPLVWRQSMHPENRKKLAFSLRRPPLWSTVLCQTSCWCYDSLVYVVVHTIVLIELATTY